MSLISHRNVSRDICNGAGKTRYKFEIHSFVECIVAGKLQLLRKI